MQGILLALGAALLWGLSTPLTRFFSETIHPVALAGWMYLASGSVQAL